MRFNQAQTHRLHHHRKGKRIKTNVTSSQDFQNAIEKIQHALLYKRTREKEKELIALLKDKGVKVISFDSNSHY